jgi:hypothetical protein
MHTLLTVLFCAALLNYPTELYPPTIDVADVKAERLDDMLSGKFLVTGLVVATPQFVDGMPVEIDSVLVLVEEAIIRDKKSAESYTVIVKEVLTGDSGSYSIMLQVTGGRFPLRRNSIEGRVTLEITARARLHELSSEFRTQRVFVEFEG